MKAAELRLGNWVDQLTYDPDFKITHLEEHQINSMDILIAETQQKDEVPLIFRGIPLTEEILIKCGFEKQMAWTWRIPIYGNKYLVYYVGEKGWSIGNQAYSDFPCRYLHQLQNAFFALTGTELEIEL